MARLLDSVPTDRAPLWHGDNVLRRLHHIHLLILSTIVDLATASIESSEEEEWLDGFGEHLTDDEAEMLRRAIEADTRLARWQGGVTEPPDNEAHPLVQLADTYREVVIAMVERTNEGQEPPTSE